MKAERTPSYQSELHPEYSTGEVQAVPLVDGEYVETKPDVMPASRDSGSIGVHDETLFDQDERNSDGAAYDESTGLHYRNSGVADEAYFVETGEGHIVDPLEFAGTDDAMGPVMDEFASEGTVDLADEWLRQHGSRQFERPIDFPQAPEGTQNVA
jgi:hypothetical protein